MTVRRLPLIVLVLIMAGGAVVGAQRFMRRSRAPLREPTAESFDGGFTFCRGMYTAVRRNPSGGGWTTDYPDADINFSIRLSELTKTRVSRRPDGEPNHLTLRLTDDNLFNCPYLHMEDMGAAQFTDEEVVRLREGGMSLEEATGKGARQVAGALFASTATTVAVFVPVLFLKDVEGQLFGDLALTISIAVAISVVTALTLLPVALSFALNRPRSPPR